MHRSSLVWPVVACALAFGACSQPPKDSGKVLDGAGGQAQFDLPLPSAGPTATVPNPAAQDSPPTLTTASLKFGIDVPAGDFSAPV